MATQQEIINWFIKQRRLGNHDFFSVPYILKSMKEEGFCINGNTRSNIRKLYSYNFLDSFRPENWKQRFRVKDKYVEGYSML